MMQSDSQACRQLVNNRKFNRDIYYHSNFLNQIFYLLISQTISWDVMGNI